MRDRAAPEESDDRDGDGNEPPHIHVERDDRTAKIWLDPLGMDRSSGYPAKELRERASGIGASNDAHGGME